MINQFMSNLLLKIKYGAQVMVVVVVVVVNKILAEIYH